VYTQHTNSRHFFLRKKTEDVCAHLFANLSILLHERFVPENEKKKRKKARTRRRANSDVRAHKRKCVRIDECGATLHV